MIHDGSNRHSRVNEAINSGDIFKRSAAQLLHSSRVAPVLPEVPGDLGRPAEDLQEVKAPTNRGKDNVQSLCNAVEELPIHAVTVDQGPAFREFRADCSCKPYPYLVDFTERQEWNAVHRPNQTRKRQRHHGGPHDWLLTAQVKAEEYQRQHQKSKH